MTRTEILQAALLQSAGLSATPETGVAPSAIAAGTTAPAPRIAVPTRIRMKRLVR